MSKTDNKVISVVLLGKIENGKSATGNTLLGNPRFQEGNGSKLQPKGIKDYSTEFNGQKFRCDWWIFKGRQGNAGNHKSNIWWGRISSKTVYNCNNKKRLS
ncbi:hypothetical protein Btru_020930 [Bulinus truncatus]|nr:hypothetical protein Btru_020930 [Bulinus truncatus]